MSTRYVDMLSQIKSVEGRVKYLLDIYPELKDKGYNYFVSKYWSYFDHVDVSPEYLARLTNAETIRRTRQKLAHENPKYASVTANKVRKFEAYREYAVSNKIDNGKPTLSGLPPDWENNQ